MFVSINRILVEQGKGEAMEHRFGASGGLKDQPGSMGFELMRRTWQGPAHGNQADAAAQAAQADEYMVVSRWESEAHFKAWLNSDAFKKAHGHGPKGPADQASKNCDGAKAQADCAEKGEAKAGACPGKAEQGHGHAQGKPTAVLGSQASGYEVVVSKVQELV